MKCAICGKEIKDPPNPVRTTTRSTENGKTTFSTSVSEIICEECTLFKEKKIVIEKVVPK